MTMRRKQDDADFTFSKFCTESTCYLIYNLQIGSIMIRRLTIRNFKSFVDLEFELNNSIVLAGPNNSGKSTMLQGITTWKYGLDRWVSQRKLDRDKRLKRSGVPITRTEFAPVPLREMNLLWEQRRVREGHPRTARKIKIILEAEFNGENWTCGLEFQYANTELIYVRPLGSKQFKPEEFQNFPPLGAENLNVIHVPTFSSIEREEPRRDQGLQNRLIGEGRPGNILRNLLLEISEKRPEYWEALTRHISTLFGIELLQPTYSSGSQAFILCEYREGSKSRTLDLSSAGSGTLQVLLLLAFLYTREASVILLDEPDVHQHVILQKQVYDLIRKIAHEQDGQLIIATHSEVILDSTEPSQVIGFIGDNPRPLHHRTERDQLREALKRITTTELLLGKEVGAILYVEGATDEKILAEWARVLNHPAQRFFKRPFIYRLGGNRLKNANDHFFAIRATFPDIRALCLLDGDNKEESDKETTKDGLRILLWKRYEIENYLLIPSAIKRFLNIRLYEQKVDEKFGKQIPPDTDLFGDIPALTRVKASNEFLVPLFEEIGLNTTKGELYQLAAKMTPDEIHPEVIEKLDAIEKFLNP